MSIFRELAPKEREVIDRLLEPVFPGREELLQQFKTAKVKTIDVDGSIEILVTSTDKVNQIKSAVPTEGEYEDSDGMIVHILLHVRAGRAKELEFYREDNSQVRSWPNSRLIKVFAPQ